MRPIALGRKNWLQIGSDRGGRTAAVLLTLVQSCTALRVEPFAYLRDLLDRVNTHPANRIAELVPESWKVSQSQGFVATRHAWHGACARRSFPAQAAQVR
jgi:hypothetical protein